MAKDDVKWGNNDVKFSKITKNSDFLHPKNV